MSSTFRSTEQILSGKIKCVEWPRHAARLSATCLHDTVCVAVTEYTTNFEGKLKPFLEGNSTVTEEEAIKLGKKNPEMYPSWCGGGRGGGRSTKR